MTDATLTIGEVAELAKINVSAIRYYERNGLLPKAERVSGQRLAARKLPEVEALIERAQAMRDWLTTASDCGCDSLECCGLFAESSRVSVEFTAS